MAKDEIVGTCKMYKSRDAGYSIHLKKTFNGILTYPLKTDLHCEYIKETDTLIITQIKSQRPNQ